MTTEDDLLTRVRAALHERNPREVRMFGGTSFMVDERMLLAVRKNEQILLRIDPTDQADLLVAGANPAVMGADRPMGPGWVTVDADHLQGDDLDRWIEHADRWHRNQGL